MKVLDELLNYAKIGIEYSCEKRIHGYVREPNKLPVPDFAIAVDNHMMVERITPVGMLWLRLYWKTRAEQGQVFETANHGVFAIPGVDICNVVVLPDEVIVSCVVKGKMLNITDDPHLFPSDSLLVKLRALQKD